VLMLLTFYRPR